MAEATHPQEELFHIYTKEGAPLGKERRSIVHKTGIWHKSCNVLLFDSNQSLLIQQRSEQKDVCPMQWDLSVAEHLSIEDEGSHIHAAQRGVQEELGITFGLDRFKLLRPIHHHTLEMDLGAKQIKDYEIVETYGLVLLPGERESLKIELQESEVAAVEWIPFKNAVAFLSPSSSSSSSPLSITPWFSSELNYLRETPSALDSLFQTK